MMASDQRERFETAERRRKKRSKRSRRELAETMHDASDRGLERAMAVPDEAWDAAVEADAEDEEWQVRKKPPKKKRKKRLPEPEVNEVVCPFCGYEGVKRYSYGTHRLAGKDAYVCERCKSAFDAQNSDVEDDTQ